MVLEGLLRLRGFSRAAYAEAPYEPAYTEMPWSDEEQSYSGTGIPTQSPAHTVALEFDKAGSGRVQRAMGDSWDNSWGQLGPTLSISTTYLCYFLFIIVSYVLFSESIISSFELTY